MTKLWSHGAAQRFAGGRITIDGIGTGLYHPSPNGDVITEADPPGCEPDLLTWIKDEQEALSLRYESAQILLLALSSGRWALFGRDFQLIEITEELDPNYLRQLSEDQNNAAAQRRMMASLIGGEPSDRQLARDLAVTRADGEKPPKMPKQPRPSMVVDI